MNFIPNDLLRKAEIPYNIPYGTFERALSYEALSVPAAYHNQRAFIRATRTRLNPLGKSRANRADYSDEELAMWRRCAHRSYKPGTSIHPNWNPVFTEECMLMNAEVGVFGRPIAEVCHV